MANNAPYKVLITGHTHGNGKALFDYFSNKTLWPKATVKGISRRDGGYDVSNAADIDRIVKDFGDYDVLVNNAFAPLGQPLLAYRFGGLWMDKANKFIINIGSVSSEAGNSFNALFAGSKAMLSHTSMTAQNYHSWPRFLMLKPGLVNTHPENKDSRFKLEATDLVKMVDTYFGLYQTHPHILLRTMVFHHEQQYLQLTD